MYNYVTEVMLGKKALQVRDTYWSVFNMMNRIRFKTSTNKNLAGGQGE